MAKYRIKQEEYITGKMVYTPQQRFCFLWFDVGVFNQWLTNYPAPIFFKLEQCQEYISNLKPYIHKPLKPIKTEYLEAK